MTCLVVGCEGLPPGLTPPSPGFKLEGRTFVAVAAVAVAVFPAEGAVSLPRRPSPTEDNEGRNLAFFSVALSVVLVVAAVAVAVVEVVVFTFVPDSFLYIEY